jgi:outer membrane protein TolC
MSHRVIVTVLWASCSCAALCLGQETPKLVLSLEQCEDLALQHSVQVQQATGNLELARLRHAQASHARFLPEVNLRNIWTAVPRARPVFTPTGVLTSPDTMAGLSDLRPLTEITLDMLQPLWTFGRLSSLRDAAAFGVEAGEADVAGKAASVLLQVRELYWGLVLGKELLEVADDAMAEVAKAENRLREELDAGSDEVSQNDLFKLQVFKYDISKKHREATDRVTLGLAALRTALGLDDTVDVEVATQELVPLSVTLDSLDRYVTTAFSNRPEMAQLEAVMNARSSIVRASKSEYFPQFFLAIQLKYNYAAGRFDSQNPFVYNPFNYFRKGFLLGLNWNLNFVQTRDKVRIAKAEVAQLARQDSALVSGIRLEVHKAYVELRQARENLRESEEALTASDNWLRAESQTFDLGLSEVKDLIDAFRANSTMRAEHLQNIFEFNTALARLTKAVSGDLLRN